jgi:predicted ATPase
VKKDTLLEAKDVGPFFTLHQSLQDYRNIVSKLGVEEAQRALRAMNDLVLLNRVPMKTPWLDSALASDAFTLSFMRNSDAFFAFHNAASILDGVLQEDLGRMSNQLALRFKLDAFENEHLFNFSFSSESIPSKRMAIMIGENGVGKSRALFRIAQSLIKGDEVFRDAKGERPNVSRLFAVASPGETSNSFPPPNLNDRIAYRRVALRHAPKGTRIPGFGEILVQLARSEDTIKGRSRWDLFAGAVSAALDFKALHVPMQASETPPISLQAMRGFVGKDMLKLWGSLDRRGEVCRVIAGRAYPLSSGEITFIRFAGQVSLFVENSTLLLIDEPEVHLHPHLVSEFVRLLDRLLALTGSFAIIATHSPYFVREVPKSQVFVISRNDRRVEIVQPRLRTLGADLGAISQYVFDDDMVPRLADEIRERSIESGTSLGDLLRQIESELPAEAAMRLKRELGIKPPQ